MDINVFASRLSPKYRILTQDEVAALLEKFKVTTKDLPKIKANDPAVKALNASEGDVIKITRKSQSAGETDYYRAVTK